MSYLMVPLEPFLALATVPLFYRRSLAEWRILVVCTVGVLQTEVLLLRR